MTSPTARTPTCGPCAITSGSPRSGRTRGPLPTRATGRCPGIRRRRASRSSTASSAAEREALEASGSASPLYNLACCEALTGRKEDAIGHLRVAFERRPSLREFAKEDTDLDPLRDEPAFRELLE